jgi:glycosyltransferase involved in cell wall biosynthesis
VSSPISSPVPSPTPNPNHHWTVAAPFAGPWLAPFVDSSRHRLTPVEPLVPETDWHSRKSAYSTPKEWRNFFEHSGRAVSQTTGGVITVFPQLAAMVALRKRTTRFDGPIVASFFDTTVVPGFRQRVHTASFRPIDHFIVHSTPQVAYYSTCFKIPIDRFSFVPLQVDYVNVPDEPLEEASPFVFATGSGCRDYKTFFSAMKRLGYPTKVVAGPRILAGLEVPSNVEILNMPRSEIRHMMRRATVNVVPLTNEGIAAGVVTFAETLRVGRCMVVTNRSETHDYVADGATGLLYREGDADDLAAKIEAIWMQPVLRDRLNHAACDFAHQHCTDPAAARALVSVLDRVVGAR